MYYFKMMSESFYLILNLNLYPCSANYFCWCFIIPPSTIKLHILFTSAFFRPQLQAANLQPVQITELEAEFAKIEGQKATPTRYIRSQQEKQAKLAAEIVQDKGKWIYKNTLSKYIPIYNHYSICDFKCI